MTSIPIDITTERLHLRTITRADVTQAYVGWLNDEHVNRYLECRFEISTLTSVRRYVDAILADHRFLFVAIEDENGTHIGNIKLGPIDWHHRRGEIGIMIGHAAAWGKGLATEAIRSLSIFGFRQLNLAKLTAHAYAPNLASIAAFQLAGYDIEGTLKEHVQLDGIRCDVVALGSVGARDESAIPPDPLC